MDDSSRFDLIPVWDIPRRTESRSASVTASVRQLNLLISRAFVNERSATTGRQFPQHYCERDDQTDRWSCYCVAGSRNIRARTDRDGEATRSVGMGSASRVQVGAGSVMFFNLPAGLFICLGADGTDIAGPGSLRLSRGRTTRPVSQPVSLDRYRDPIAAPEASGASERESDQRDDRCSQLSPDTCSASSPRWPAVGLLRGYHQRMRRSDRQQISRSRLDGPHWPVDWPRGGGRLEVGEKAAVGRQVVRPSVRRLRWYLLDFDVAGHADRWRLSHSGQNQHKCAKFRRLCHRKLLRRRLFWQVQRRVADLLHAIKQTSGVHRSTLGISNRCNCFLNK